MKPVYGFAREEIIGHWDDASNKFIAKDDETMKRASNRFLAGNDIYPLAVRVMDNDINNEYATYRAIGSKFEDPRVIIYAEEDENKKVILRLK